MKQLFRVNDIVTCTTHYNNGVFNDVYAKITRIVLNNTEYNRMMITTGMGEKNTRCLIDITYICNAETLEQVNGNRTNVDPHNLVKPKFSKEIERCLKNIELNKKRIAFFNKYENPSREKIINDLLSEEDN